MKNVFTLPMEPHQVNMIELYTALIILTSLRFECSYSSTSTCPADCSCRDGTRQVACRKQGWTELPRNFARGAKIVDLSGNQINLVTSMNLERAGLHEVIKLNLSDNEIEKVIDGAFSPMLSLQSLDLSWNNLTELGENAFHSCKYLKSVDISHNNLRFIDGVFHGLKDLSRLDLQYNKITTLTHSTFKDSTNLTYLNLAHNNIFRIDKKAFKTLEKLMFLFLNENSISDMIRLQFNSYFLSNVDFSSCKIQQIPKGLPNSIKYLQLRKNNLSTLDKTSFQDCPYVSILILDDNSITDIQDGCFSKMIYLQQLWLNNNLLVNIPHKFPGSLESLSLESNQIQQLHPNDPPLDSKLNYLVLSCNLIKDIDSSFFSKLKQLIHLDLNDNKISRISSGTFEMNGKLKVLILSKNPIVSIDPGGLRGLFDLTNLFLPYIESPDIVISSDCFEDMLNLTNLIIEGSPSLIKIIVNSEDHLKHLNSLKNLNMVDSQLSRLRSNFPSFFPNLEYLQLTSDKWFCDETILWLKKVLASHVIDLRSAEANRCYAPLHLKGKTVISLRDEQFSHFPNINSNNSSTTTPAMFTFKRRNFIQQNSSLNEITDDFLKLLQTRDDVINTHERENLPHINDRTIKNKPNSNYFTSRFKEEFVREVPAVISSSNKLAHFKNETSQRRHKNFSKSLKMTTQSLNVVDESMFLYRSSYRPSSVMSVSLKPSRYKLEPSKDRPRFDSSYFLCGAVIMVLVFVCLVLGLALYCFLVNSNRKQNPSTRYNSSFSRLILQRLFKHRRNEGVKKEESEAVKLNSTPEDTLKIPVSEASIALIPARDIHHEGPKRVYTWTDF